MAATLKYKRKSRLAALLGLLLALALLATACEHKPPAVSPQAQALAQEIKRELAHWQKLLAAKAAKSDRQAIAAAMATVYQDECQAGHPLKYGVMALDKEGYLLAARYADPQRPEGYPDTDYPQNYGNFEVVKASLSEGRTRAGMAYTDLGKSYMVSTPLTQQNKVVGAFLLGYTGHELVDVLGVSEADFLALDYTPAN